jgi:hypothetical protein
MAVPLRRRFSAVARSWAAAALMLAGCQPVPVRIGEVTHADVGVPAAPRTVNLVAIGIAVGDQPIVVRPTGLRVSRGTSATIGVAGAGVEPGTTFAVVGLGFGLRLIRVGTTQGGGQAAIPAAVLSLDVGSDVGPGLYSLVAVRGAEYSVLAGGIEVF